MRHDLRSDEPGMASSTDPRWAKVLARDRTADGSFWYSVATTGVYCRPSCPSRTANPRNVAFHETREDARAMGFRACRRCRPDEPAPGSDTIALVAKACRRIERSEDAPSLATLAAEADLSPGYFHRVFKAATGVTPRDYAVAQRADRVREGLLRSRTVTEAFYDAGFNSSGRFYANTSAMLGMTPKRYRAGGMDEEIRFAVGRSSLGEILVASSARGVVAILMGDDPDTLARDLQDRFPRATIVGGDRGYEDLVARVVGLVEAPDVASDLPLDIRGTAFQQRVWQVLRTIPAGRTMSYAEVAKAMGAPKTVRAVAGACAANSIAVATPCHRVVRSDGSLSGYAWGVERKRRLLDKEAEPSRRPR